MTEKREPLYKVVTEESSDEFYKFEDAVNKYEECQDQALEDIQLILNLPDFMVDITYIYQAGVDTGIFKYERIAR